MFEDRIDNVARAFYAAESEGDWESASEAERNQFRDLAGHAIMLLESADLRRNAPPPPRHPVPGLRVANLRGPQPQEHSEGL